MRRILFVGVNSVWVKTFNRLKNMKLNKKSSLKISLNFEYFIV